MSRELKNLFATPEPSRIVATVLAKTSTTGYLVRDRSRRKFPVLADGDYPPGSEVLVESGRIVGRLQVKPIKRYEV